MNSLPWACKVLRFFEVDTRQRRDIVLLIESLLYSIDPMLENSKASQS